MPQLVDSGLFTYHAFVLSFDLSFIAVAAVEQVTPEPDSIRNVISTEATSRQEQSQPELATIEEITTPYQISDWVQVSTVPIEAEAGAPTSSSSAPNTTSSPRSVSPSSSSSSASSSALQQSSASATIPPMDIAGAGSSTSQDSPVQQSPSAAFLMAPSPPMFVSNFGLSPIPFAAPSSVNSNSGQHSSSPPSQRAEHHQHAPSSPSSHMGHMFQNFVRNITIPHRNRSRTNSNPATSPVATTNNTPGQTAASVGHGTQERGATGGGAPTDVFGKTLVMTPPAMLLSNNRASVGGELGVVSETEADTEPSLLQDGEHDNNGHASTSRSSSREAAHAHEGSSADNLAMHNAHTITAGANV